jgi:hypothetical protein
VVQMSRNEDDEDGHVDGRDDGHGSPLHRTSQ